MRLPRWLCQQQWDSGIASSWLLLLLWSPEREASLPFRTGDAPSELTFSLVQVRGQMYLHVAASESAHLVG